MDLEVLHGNQTSAALLWAWPLASFNIIRVKVRDMILQDGPVLKIDLNATGLLSNVLFINCHGTNNPHFIEVYHPSKLIVEAITISGARPGTNTFLFQYSLTELTVPNITFGGNILMEGGMSIITFIGGLSATQAIRSNPYNPARYYITPSIATPIVSFLINTGHFTFEAQSVYVGSPGRRLATEAFSLAGGANPQSTINITIHEDFIVDGMSSINSRNGLFHAALQVGGLFSTLNSASSAILISCPTLITAGSAVLGNASSALLSLTSNLTMKVSTDLLIWNPPTPSASYSTNPAANVHTNIEVGNTFNMTNSRLLISSGRLSLSAKKIIFERSISTFSGGGAISALDGATVSLFATENILFKGNQAKNGGAIYAGPLAVLTLSGSTRFESNIASQNGGAAYVSSRNFGALNTSSFWSNQATSGQGCTVYSDSCTPFTTSGTYGFNLQLVNNTAFACSYNEDQCSTSLPPSTTPRIPCTGIQPSVGTWICQNGQWTSVGDVSAELLTIPGTPVVVIGNLSVSGDLTFTGLESSVTVQDGCAYIAGTLKIELTADDLEAISKEDGSSRTLALITQSSNCSSLTGIDINAYKSGSNCRYIESTTTSDVSNGSRSTLTALFKVNSSRCNTKWIILGCVLGGILLIVLVIMLVFTFNDKARSAVRPFWARGLNKSE